MSYAKGIWKMEGAAWAILGVKWGHEPPSTQKERGTTAVEEVASWLVATSRGSPPLPMSELEVLHKTNLKGNRVRE